MYGAIIGDVAGSYYEILEIEKIKLKRSYSERIKIMKKDIPLFDCNSSCTDDSILTIAIADAIMSNCSYKEKLKEYGLRQISLGLDKYNRNPFGKGFMNWLENTEMGFSCGNGSAMRISSVGYLFDTLKSVKEESFKATIPSHNHKESILCAESVAVSIYLIRKGIYKSELKKYIENNYFPLNYNIEELRENYRFSSKAIESVPQAIFCFLESDNFEDAIRKSISIGGDCDTIACIAGSLAEAYYGVSQNLIDLVNPYILEYMFPVIDRFYEKVKIKK